MAADDSLVKKPGQSVAYTREQIDELRKCMDPKTGPEYFISNYMYIQHPVRGKEKIQLYPYQLELLYNYHNYRKSVNMLGRQMGKCVTGCTKIHVRNKTTGETKSVTIEEFGNILQSTSDILSQQL